MKHFARDFFACFFAEPLRITFFRSFPFPFASIMEKDNDHHFEVGQLVEARTFVTGFRGAWFRCKITDIRWRDGHIGHVLRYLDFPDEKDKGIRLYQIPPTGRRKGTERQIMVRPPFPPIYSESQMPPVDAISEVIVITERIWNVGHLVDWWQDDCYWSAKITQILGNEKAMVELMPPPMGEGLSYVASFSDLRPSLDWSPEDGWTLPTPKDGGNYRHCARLVHPVNQSGGGRLALDMEGEGTVDSEAVAELSSAGTFSFHVATKSLAASEKVKTCGTNERVKVSQGLSKEVMGTAEDNTNSKPGDCGSRKTSFSDSTYPSHTRDASAETAGPLIGEPLSDFSSLQKKLRTSLGISLNSTRSDTLEAAIVDLEELANKIKWLKGILKLRSPSPNAVGTSWMFFEHRGPSMS